MLIFLTLVIPMCYTKLFKIHNFGQTQLYIGCQLRIEPTCFHSKESSSGYSMNHNIDTSSGIPKRSLSLEVSR